MRKWAVLALLISFLLLPNSVHAQAGVVFNDLGIQLLPEYDQASMLVIYDFSLADTVNIPPTLTIKIPADANLFAVAYNQDGNLLNALFSGPELQGEWQVIAITTNGTVAYRIEYYEPLSFKDTSRQFTYLWPGDYAINNFNVFLGKPLDLTQITTEPVMDEMQRSTDGLEGLGKSFGSLAKGEQFTLLLQYGKTSDALVMPPQELQPSAPVDDNTPGRVSLTNYLPYVLGGLGFLLIAGGFVYYWQSGRKHVHKPRRRHSTQTEQEEGEEQYCHQCGTRAKPSDRFCRVCGSRLRQES